MPEILLRLPPETCERIDVVKARRELQERRSVHRSTVLLRILDAGCAVLEMAREAARAAGAPIVPERVRAPEAVRAERTPMVHYDTTRHYLGKLCKRGHGYQGRRQSLRRKSSHQCVVCDPELAAERREAKRQKEG